jgi:hypothetical protein
MIVEVILIDETQKIWVDNENENGNFKAPICDYGQGDCISADVLTLGGYEAWATYFDGATVTEIELDFNN